MLLLSSFKRKGALYCSIIINAKFSFEEIIYSNKSLIKLKMRKRSLLKEKKDKKKK